VYAGSPDGRAAPALAACGGRTGGSRTRDGRAFTWLATPFHHLPRDPARGPHLYRTPASHPPTPPPGSSTTYLSYRHGTIPLPCSALACSLAGMAYTEQAGCARRAGYAQPTAVTTYSLYIQRGQTHLSRAADAVRRHLTCSPSVHYAGSYPRYYWVRLIGQISFARTHIPRCAPTPVCTGRRWTLSRLACTASALFLLYHLSTTTTAASFHHPLYPFAQRLPLSPFPMPHHASFLQSRLSFFARALAACTTRLCAACRARTSILHPPAIQVNCIGTRDAEQIRRRTTSLGTRRMGRVTVYAFTAGVKRMAYAHRTWWRRRCAPSSAPYAVGDVARRSNAVAATQKTLPHAEAAARFGGIRPA